MRNHAAYLLNDEPLPSATPAEESGKGGGSRPIAVTEQTWQSVVLKSKEPVLVDFWASWCAPCRAVAPYVEQLAGEYKGKLKVAKLDTDAHQAIARRYQIQSIPTFIVFQNGEPVQRMSGANPGAIKRMIDLTLNE